MTNTTEPWEVTKFYFVWKFCLAACRIKGKTKDAIETKSKEVRAWPRVSFETDGL